MQNLKAGVVFVVFLMLTGLAGCGGESGPAPRQFTLGVCVSGVDDEGAQWLQQGAAAKLDGQRMGIDEVTLRWAVADDAIEQASMVRGWVAEGIDGLAVMAAGDAVNEALIDARAAGVEVVAFLRDAGGEARSVYLGVNERMTARLVVRQLRAMADAPGAVALVGDSPLREAVQAALAGDTDRWPVHEGWPLASAGLKALVALGVDSAMMQPLREGAARGVRTLAVGWRPELGGLIEDGVVEQAIAPNLVNWSGEAVAVLLSRLREGNADPRVVLVRPTVISPHRLVDWRGRIESAFDAALTSDWRLDLRGAR